MNTTTLPALVVGTTVIIDKGCAARDLPKGTRMTVQSVVVGERNSVKVVFIAKGRTLAWYAQHTNRLADPNPAFNDGDPTHRIVVRRA